MLCYEFIIDNDLRIEPLDIWCHQVFSLVRIYTQQSKQLNAHHNIIILFMCLQKFNSTIRINNTKTFTFTAQ